MLSTSQIRRIVMEATSGLEKTEIDEMAIPSYLHWNPAVRWIIRKRLQVIADCMKRRKIGSYLDFGCGIGVLLQEMAASCGRIYGTDLCLDPARTNIKQNRLVNVTLAHPNELSASVPPESLDGVVAADVLEHVEDVTACLRVFEGLLKPDGLFFLSGPTENFIYKVCRKIAGFTGDYHVRDVHDIEATLRGLGWDQEELMEIPAFSPFKLFRVTAWRRRKTEESAEQLKRW